MLYEVITPIVIPQITVALAPIVAPRLIVVVKNSDFRSMKARGFFTLVNTQLGPQKTSSRITSYNVCYTKLLR